MLYTPGNDISICVQYLQMCKMLFILELYVRWNLFGPSDFKIILLKSGSFYVCIATNRHMNQIIKYLDETYRYSRVQHPVSMSKQDTCVLTKHSENASYVQL